MTRLLVGTYAEKGGPGLVPIAHDAETDRWRAGEPVAHVRNASFGIVSPVHGHWHLVDEAAGTVSTYSAAGGWAVLATVETGGEAPCHLALSAHDGGLAVANYGSGSVTLLSLNDAGLPIGGATYANEGRGPNAERQEGPHAHWVGFGPAGESICVDLGADRVFARDPATPAVARTLYAAPPGSGPRHLAFHPVLPVAYLVSELASTLTVLRPEGAMLRADAMLSTLPEGAADASLGGAIALSADATRLWVSNRGHDSIATFALDAEGAPHPLGHVASGGASPRFLLPLADGRLAVAHEEGGGVAVFRLDEEGRPLPAPATIDVPGAVFLIHDLPGE